jgi:hypothetical protein
MSLSLTQLVRVAAGMFIAATVASPQPVHAWAASSPRGGVVAGGPRGGVVAAGPRGGVVAAGPRGGVAAARPRYPAYRPPVRVAAVPVYPGYARPVAQVAGAVAVGVVAGAAVAAATKPSTTVIVTQPAYGAPLVIGNTLTVLPSGCTVRSVNSVSYYICGTSWVRPEMQGANVNYVVVPSP